jgi:hypothetical protein
MNSQVYIISPLIIGPPNTPFGPTKSPLIIGPPKITFETPKIHLFIGPPNHFSL